MEPAGSTQSNDQTRYVEELESQDDYWLSITDASRVCRVQDVSIRRAITSGRLPVRAQGAGDNKRTRFVRASDLPRANFPILDAGAAITSDIRKVDILNIPLQVQRLTQLLTQVQATHSIELGQIHEQLEAIQEAQRVQAEQYQQDQITTKERIEQTTAALSQQQEESDRRYTVIDERIGNLANLALAQAQQYNAFKEELIAQVQAIQTSLPEQVQQAEKRLQDHVRQAEERLRTQFQADVAALRKEFEEHARVEARKIDVLTRQIEQEKEQRVEFERIMTRVATGADAAASEAKATVATLVSQLETERKARLALEERLNRYEAQESARTPAPPSTRKPSSRRKATESST